MFKTGQRLHARTRLSNPKIEHTPFFSVRVAKNGKEVSRFGFVVSKKVDKRAVERNRVRRLLATCIQEIEATLPTGLDALFFLKAGIKDATKESIKTAIRTTLGKMTA